MSVWKVVWWLCGWVVGCLGAGCLAGGVGEVVVMVVVYFNVCCASECACARRSRCGLVEKEEVVLCRCVGVRVG